MARMYQWRITNRDKVTLQRRKERVRRRLRDLDYLPPVGVEMTPEQKKIYEDIGNNDYTFWDMVKKGTPGKLHDGGKQITNSTINKSYERLIYERAKQSAQQRNLEFNLDVEDIVIPEYCPYLNIKLTFEYSIETRNSYYSIDRIDSRKGYIKGNIQIISLKANTMKNDSTNEELIIFSKNVLKQNRQGNFFSVFIKNYFFRFFPGKFLF
jgi:hypothetical protein